jgi:hypothetical protein
MDVASDIYLMQALGWAEDMNTELTGMFEPSSRGRYGKTSCGAIMKA